MYQLHEWLCNVNNNFVLKNCLFGIVKLVTNTMESKFTYNDGGIAFDGAGTWSFCNDFARVNATFSVDNTSSSHTDNQKSNILVSSEGPTHEIYGSFGTVEKKLVLTLIKQRQNFV